LKARALTRCFVANCLRQEGEVFEYEGPANACLEILGGKTPAPKAAGKAPPAGKKPSIEEALA
jgi:hypothetical protein